MKGFFQFYADFDFKNNGLSLILASVTGKDTDASLVIENPVEPHLNVTMNVQTPDLDKLKSSCREAVTLLESRDGTSNNWGLTRILDLGVEDKTTEEKSLLKSEAIPMSRLFSEQDEDLYDNIDDEKGILKSAGVSMSEIYNKDVIDDVNSNVDTENNNNVNKSRLPNGNMAQEIPV